jgi:tetratricopeptide (TPR) repeat protein
MFSGFCSDRLHIAAMLAVTAIFLGGCAAVKSPPAAVAEPVDSAPPIADVPAEAEALYTRAVDALAAGHAREAELRFHEFLQQYPGYTGAYVNLAIIFAGRDDLDAAEIVLRKALDRDPGHSAALNQLGLLHRRRGEFDAAEVAYKNAILSNPEYALAHVNLGILNDLYLRRLDTALTHYEHYESLVGEDPEVSRWMSDLKRRIAATQSTANLTK